MIKVPLVVYKNGVRHIVGEAVVHGDGYLEGKFSEGIELGEALNKGLVFGARLAEPIPNF